VGLLEAVSAALVGAWRDMCVVRFGRYSAAYRAGPGASSTCSTRLLGTLDASLGVAFRVSVLALTYLEGVCGLGIAPMGDEAVIGCQGAGGYNAAAVLACSIVSSLLCEPSVCAQCGGVSDTRVSTTVCAECGAWRCGAVAVGVSVCPVSYGLCVNVVLVGGNFRE
jgi:hypothetical protein